MKGGTRRLLHRNREENRGSVWGHHVEKWMEEGSPVRVVPREGRWRTGPGVLAAAWERRREALVGRCPAPCESMGEGARVGYV
jgi:hypothetical protein